MVAIWPTFKLLWNNTYQIVQVHCVAVLDDGPGGKTGNNFTVAYDKLVIASGAEATTFGIKGVMEHALFLRDVQNARDIRTKLLLNLMLCEIPGA
jgi:NADH:ubiquinone reductase (non-electrogenic)